MDKNFKLFLDKKLCRFIYRLLQNQEEGETDMVQVYLMKLFQFVQKFHIQNNSSFAHLFTN